MTAELADGDVRAADSGHAGPTVSDPPGAAPLDLWPVAGQQLLDLTDEELAALDPPAAEETLVVLPHLSRLDPAGRAVAVATARRLLLERGVVAAAGTDDGGDQDGLLVDELVSDVLTARARAWRVVTAQRTTAAGTDFLYLYRAADDVGELQIAEYVSAGGLHRFTLLAAPEDPAAAESDTPADGGGPDAAGPEVAVLADYLAPVRPPPGTAVHGAGDREVSVAALGAGDLPAELSEELTGAAVQGEFVVLHLSGPRDAGSAGGPVLHGVFAGAAALLTSDIGLGSHEPVLFTHRSGEAYVAWVRTNLDEATGVRQT